MTRERPRPQAFFIATSKGAVVEGGVLDSFSVGTRALVNDVFGQLYGEAGLVEPLYEPTGLLALLEANTYHARCVKVKAQDVSGNDYQLKPAPDLVATSLVDDLQKQGIKSFLSNQNPSIPELIKRAQQDWDSVGYCALEVVREAYDPSRPPLLLNHIPAHTIRIHQTREKFCQLRNNKRVWFKPFFAPYDINYSTAEKLALGACPPELRATEIIWLINYSSRSDYYGIPDIIPASGAVLGHIYQRDYNIRFFQRYGVPNYAIYITGDYDLGKKVKGEYPIVRTIKRHLTELATNPHAPLVIAIPPRKDSSKVEIKFERLAADAKESQFRLYKEDNLFEVCCAHGVPPYRIGFNVQGSLGGTTAKESTQIYSQSVITPRQLIWQEVFNFLFKVGFGINNWKFWLDSIDNGDEELLLKVATFMFDSAGMTPNELIRAFPKLGLRPSTAVGMDYHYLKGVCIENGEALKAKATPAPFGGGGGSGFQPASSDVAVKEMEEFQNRLLTILEQNKKEGT
jgi:PBSX family phage portal protein